jgi:hypothetical protein
LSIAFTFSLVLLGSVTTAQKPNCEATVFVLQSLEREPAVASPDGRYRVLLGVKSEGDEHGWLYLYAGANRLQTYQLHDLSGGVFVNWSPDSRAFYVMWSNGGAIGAYDVRAFRLGAAGASEVPLTSLAEREFERRHPCQSRGHNVYAVRWFKGSEQMLLALQVYPTSDCGKQMGHYRGYLARVDDGAILRRYSEKELKAVWPAGCPSAIYPTAFWTADDLEKAKQQQRRQRRERAPRKAARYS